MSWWHTEKSSKKKIIKATTVLNDKIDQLNLAIIYMTSHPKKAEYTFFSSTYETFTSTYQILGCNTSPKKFKKIEIISSIFYDDNSIKLENDYK